MLLAAVTDWCRRFTPLAALDQPDGAILDVSGVTHLSGGADNLLCEIETGLGRQGFACRLSLAPHAAAAAAFARWNGPRLVPDETLLLRAVRKLPIAALRLDDTRLARFRDSGLRSLGDLLLRPRAPVAARFGADVFARIDAMLGQRGTPLSPRFEAPPYMAERRFAEGLARREDISRVLSGVCEELCAMLARHEEGTRQIRASFFRVDGAVRHLDVATSRPMRDPRSLLRLLDERLDAIGEEGLDTGYGFDVIRLAATAVEPLPGEQAALRQTLTHAGDREADFGDLVDRLGARLGTRRVQRFDFVDTHWPEAAALLRPAAQGPADVTALDTGPATDACLATRPTRLFERPEPIESIGAVVPDGPPARFRWRRFLHEVVAFEGPERIAAEWWKETGPTRDYFRLEDASGGRFWVFREGLFGAEVQHPRWFMHGVFG